MSETMWCTIESDPGVFTELMNSIGVKDVQMEEIYSFDESIKEYSPVYGLIFLFKWQEDKRQNRNVLREYDTDKIFFASQVIGNACATQAILSILLNAKDLDVGPELRNFKEFTKSFSADMKGLAISNSELIRTAHNSFARPEPLSIEKKGRETEEAFHFISYLPIDGKLYELDGLQVGPIYLGDCPNDENWIDAARPFIQSRIEQYQHKEIRFNLMAIVKNRQTKLRQTIEFLEKKRKCAEELLNNDGVDRMDTSEMNLPSSREELQSLINEIDEQVMKKQGDLQMEVEKFEQWRLENICRRHNYIPFIVNLLKILGEKGELTELINAAKRKD